MKKQDKKAADKKAKVSSALTGPGLLQPSELDQASGGGVKKTGGDSVLCLPLPTR
jgi:hypothetical protein